MARIIALDAGHGLYTAGKQTPTGIKEWSLNDSVRDKVVANLKDYDVSIVNVDNNEGKTDESLSARVNAYINAKAEAVVSIHHNAFTGDWNGATGVEVYVDNKATDADIKLANCIYSRLVKYTGLKGRGVKRADFAVINQNIVPAVLVEGGFMDGSEDYKVITSEEGQKAYARAVSEGLVEFLSLKKKPVETKPTTPAVNTSTIKEGDVVSVKSGATYYTGAQVPTWVTKKQWIVESVNGDRVVINKSSDGVSAINSPIAAKFLSVVKSTGTTTKPATNDDTTSFKPYVVRVNIPNLNIRKGPGTQYPTTGKFTGRGSFTIVEVKNGSGSNKGWGKLKSGAGWISLDFTTKA